MDLQLENKTVLVTGAARGVGLACVRGFLAEGACVVATDITVETGVAAADALVAENQAWAKRIRIIPADMCEEDAIALLIDQAEAEFGPIDICVNNAAVTHRVEFLDMQTKDFDRVLATNLRGPFILGQAVARRLQAEEREGAIINIGSVNAQLALPDNAAYVASKGGLLQLTRAMALALADCGIRVNMVAPGSIDTPLQRRGMSRSPELLRRVLSRTPLGRLGLPDEVADAVLYLSSPRASYITGTCLYVDGGRLPLNFTVPVDEAAMDAFQTNGGG